MVNAYDVSGRVHNKPLMVVSFGERVGNEGWKENFYCYILGKGLKCLTRAFNSLYCLFPPSGVASSKNNHPKQKIKKLLPCRLFQEEEAPFLVL